MHIFGRPAKRLALSLLLSAGVLACDDDPEEDVVAEPSEPEPPPVFPDPGPEATVSAEQWPIADDFADEADSTIDESNYRAELDRLRSEIDDDL